MSGAAFIAGARERYAAANAAALRWMLERPRLGGCFLNTKLNPLTLQDYGVADGRRGPGHLYGWIQGRGLEALALHAAFFDGEDAGLAAALDAAAGPLADGLAALAGPAGRVFFRYEGGVAVDGEGHPQPAAPAVETYSDIFAAKGLTAAAWRLGRRPEPALARLDAIAAAIEAGHFQMDEARPLAPATAAVQPADFGPRMILLGAAGLLHRIGRPECAAFADRFIAHVLTHHFDPASGLLRSVPGGDHANPGHAIEFVGFAMEHPPAADDPGVRRALGRILVASFAAGFDGRGIALSVSVPEGRALSPFRPWWSLPETIRAAALLFEHERDDAVLAIWQAADAAFFRHYWRGTPPIAFQTLDDAGPVDHVPATPDLDPGYHTGLSLLAAIRAADALTAP
jgi:mannose/cellobiose epimerase-like protein (N-acyl-D-glucosamine 2-epimerase family)